MASSLVRRGFRLSLLSRRSSTVARASPVFCSSFCNCPRCSPVTKITSFRNSLALQGAVRSFSSSKICSSFCNCPRCSPVTKITSFRNSLALQGAVRSFSSSKIGADENLKKVLQTEIQEASDIAETQDQQYPMPDGFAFSIQDKPGEQTITLERVHHGETIKAVVFLNLEEDEDMEGKDEDAEDDDGSVQSSISMVVTIDKGEDSLVELCCSVNPEEIQIDNMAIKKRDASDDHELYEGPPFSDLDENLQNEFHRYLEARGISNSLFGFLQDYMVKKDEREYITWLKNMRDFVES